MLASACKLVAGKQGLLLSCCDLLHLQDLMGNFHIVASKLQRPPEHLDDSALMAGSFLKCSASWCGAGINTLKGQAGYQRNVASQFQLRMSLAGINN